MTRSIGIPAPNSEGATAEKKPLAFLQHLLKCPCTLSMLVAAGFVVFLCLHFQPRWDTNDDVFMSMTAHGYGHAAYGSPQLIHSNLLWGYIVRGFPQFHHILGYSLATMFVLFLAAWCIHYSLLRLGTGWLVSTLSMGLVFARPVLFPQFTINAGLLTLAAIVGLRAYAQQRQTTLLVGAAILAFLGFLVRSFEFFLVAAVALPLIPWNVLKQKPVQIAAAILCAAIAIAWGVDRRSYSGPEWQHHREFYKASIPYLAFGAGNRLKKRPDIIARHGYSSNDVDLINNWFFADPQLFDPQRLTAMLDELGPVSLQSPRDTLNNVFIGIEALGDKILLPVLVGAGVLCLLYLRWPVALVWCLCLGAIAGMGAAGRPGQLRVYVPLVSLLLVSPLVMTTFSRWRLQWRVSTPVRFILLVACIVNFQMLAREARKSSRRIQELKAGCKQWPKSGVVSWGATFPYEYVFHVFATDLSMRRIPIHALAWSIFAPYEVSTANDANGKGFLCLLHSEQGVCINASPVLTDCYLATYCREHFGTELRILETNSPGPKMQQRLQWIRCRADPVPSQPK